MNGIYYNIVSLPQALCLVDIKFLSLLPVIRWAAFTLQGQAIGGSTSAKPDSNVASQSIVVEACEDVTVQTEFPDLFRK